MIVSQHCHKIIVRKFNSTGKTKFVISTPIFYVNSVPHIGHLYSAVLADTIARWQRIQGREVVFSTGTDEHGIKVQQAAVACGKEPQEFCNEISQSFVNLFDVADIGYTDFIRTTEERHKNSVISFWNKLNKAGFLYKGSYNGYYCASDETFVPDNDVLVVKHPTDEAQTLKVRRESMQPVEWISETNYMFRLSDFSETLLRHYEKLPESLCPPIFRNQVLATLDLGLSDISVSRLRDRLEWGIPVPGDPSQVIYVWLDALVNYLTVSGYPNADSYWPAAYHVIGKDILKFHAIYWPAFLLAAGLSLPRHLLCHSHWTLGGMKMSKSKGNVTDPIAEMSKFGVDSVRYFLMRNHNLHSDSNYSSDLLLEIVNKELANQLGNLYSRSTSKKINRTGAIGDLFHNRLQDVNPKSEPEERLLEATFDLFGRCDQYYQDGEPHRVLDAVNEAVRRCNVFFDSKKPWTLADSSEELRQTLEITYQTLALVAILLQPVIPQTANRLLNGLGQGTHVDREVRIFPRIEK